MKLDWSRVGAAWVAIAGSAAPLLIAIAWPDAWRLEGRPAATDMLIAAAGTFVAATTLVAWGVALPRSVAGGRAGCCLFPAAIVSASACAWALEDALLDASFLSAPWPAAAAVNTAALALARSLRRLLPDDPDPPR